LQRKRLLSLGGGQEGEEEEEGEEEWEEGDASVPSRAIEAEAECASEAEAPLSLPSHAPQSESDGSAHPILALGGDIVDYLEDSARYQGKTGREGRRERGVRKMVQSLPRIVRCMLSE